MSNRRLSNIRDTLLIGGIIGWMFGPTMAQISQRWSDTPEYSHGWLVPAFAMWVAWSDRGKRSWSQLDRATILGLSLLGAGLAIIVAAHQFDQAGNVATVGAVLCAWGTGFALVERSEQPATLMSKLFGWLLVVGGAASQIAGAYLYIDWLSAAAIVPVLWGVSLIWWPGAFRHSVWWSIAFLAFMIPLPFSIETGLREPLRKIATKVSSYVLETLGFPCVTEGFVISIGESQIGVTEACSGLSMLMVFAALTFGCVMIVDRPWWYRAILSISWPVIAILANVFRIVVTGGLLAMGFEKLADITFHDLAGLAMMPVGLMLLWAEMWYLDSLVVLESEQRLGQMLSPIPKAG
jgi:exosortase